MSEILTHNIQDEKLCINFSGRIDASNASSVEDEIAGVCVAEGKKVAVIDAQDLEYISSAGLRIILRLRKEEPELTIINVSQEVYEILDMTGFTEMINVKKAYRRLSIEGCEKIGKGANGAVYRYDAETIVKIYFNSDALPEIQRERELARKALILGINTAIPYDIVRIGDSYGTVMELLAAESLSKMILKEPDNLELPLKYYIDMLRHIHETKVKPGEIPNMKEKALKWAAFDKDYLDKETGEKLYKLIEDIPDTCNMLHGDYHTSNVMVRDGEAILIDMDTLCMGHPIFELGFMFNSFMGFAEYNKSTTLMGLPYELANKFWHMALSMYIGTDDSKKLTEVEDKARIIGYMRLLRRTVRRDEPDKEELFNLYKGRLEELIPKFDTLTFCEWESE